MLILRAFRKTNSVISTAEVLTVLLPERDVLEMIMLIADFQLIFLLWNLFWFLTYQIVLRILFRQEVMATLHWGVHFLSHSFQMSEILFKWRGMLRMEASQDHIATA